MINDKKEKVNVHTLNSCNYLKIDKQNHIRFEFNTKKSILEIMSQHKDEDDQTVFESIYKIKIKTMFIR